MNKPTAPTLELTVRAVLLGLMLSVVMGAANVYLGLKAGLTVSASVPAAVIAMLILRGVLRTGTILEANQVQTAASAGESLAAGIIFTMPALVMIGVWSRFDWLLTTLVAFAGGLLGILFMIPMRRVFVVADDSELRYPEGVACAAVLEAGQQQEDPEGARAVVRGAGLGALFKFLSGFAGLLLSTLETASRAGTHVLYFGADVSPALVAVGFIVRLNVALLIFIGGAMAWLIGIPLLDGGVAEAPLDTAWSLWSTQIRYVGVGAMVVGGISSIFKVRHGLVQAIRHMTQQKTDQVQSEDDRDLPSALILSLTLVAVAITALVYYRLTKEPLITALTTVIMVVMAFFFSAVASYIVGLVGNSNSPVSGMTITAVLFSGVLLVVFGFSGVQGMVATLGVAAIVCCAACTSGDVCNDLKTGQIVGASPQKQQIMQVLGVVVAALIMAPILQLLHDNTPGGIGGRELAAPQAGLFASLAKGFFGEGQIPTTMVVIGAAIGLVILVIDDVLARRRAHFRLHLMPVAVGMYLPFGLAAPILLGGLLAHFRAAGEVEAAADKRLHKGVLFASGMIAGESLMGVGLALLASLQIARPALGLPASAQVWLTLLAAAGIGYLFFRQSAPSS